MAELRIRELTLRVGDLDEAEAQALGRRVADLLARRISDAGAHDLGAVEISLPADAARDPGLAERIAERIARAIS